MKNVAFFFLLVVLFSCNKKVVENFEPLSYQDYFPVNTGEVTIYRLDSITTTPFGTSLIKRSYHLKDSIVEAFNIGKDIYRVHRFISDTLESSPWSVYDTYLIGRFDNQLEIRKASSTRRIIELVTPVREAYSWKGNIRNNDPSITAFATSYADSWIDAEFTYSQINKPIEINGKILDNTLTVTVSGRGWTDWNEFESRMIIPDPKAYRMQIYNRKIWQKGTGLIEDILFCTIQQPDYTANSPGRPFYENGSFGIEIHYIRKEKR